MKKFKQCCLCFDLRLGVKIISLLWILYVITSVLLPLGFEVSNSETNNSPNTISTNITRNNNGTISIIDDNNDVEDDNDNDDDDHNPFSIFGIHYVVIGFYIILIILSVLLYIGAAKDKYKLMIPWLIGTMLQIMYTFIQSIIILVGLFILSLNSIAFAFIIFIIFAFPFQLYLWFCVYSLYYKLKHEIISAV